MGERDRMLVAERSDLFLWKKVKEWFWSCISLLICAFFWSLSRDFSISGDSVLFGHCHVTLPYMVLLSCFGRFVQKVKKSCFADSFVQKTTQQSDGSCSVTSYSQFLHNFFKKTASLFLQTQMKNKFWVKNTVLLATMTRCASYTLSDITLF